MSSSLSKKSLRVEDATMLTKKQGIGSILGPDNATEAPSTKVASLRRTLSADMSSKKWLSQQGFSPLKRVASSQQFPVSSIISDSSSSSSEEDYEERKELGKNRKVGKFDIWSSIISQKGEEDSSKSAPVYVHPLVKRSSATLSEKSLEICTESLGSETGSDGFSSNPPSESGDYMQEDIIDHKEEEKDHRVEEPRVVVKHHKYDVCKKSTHNSTSFPPPIPSLSRENVRIKTHRDNGRLVLEAVSMPSKNNFVAQRQDGRLVLTFSTTNPTAATAEEEEEEEDDQVEEFEKESEMEQQAPPKLPIGAMNVHRLAVMMNKPIWSANWNPTWPTNLDDIVKFEENNKVEPTSTKTPPPPPPPLAQSLPPRPPRMAGRLIPSTPPSTTMTTETTSSNAYEYYWRRPNNQAMSSKKNLKAYNNDFPSSKGCKEQKRSLLFREPYCIAT